MDKIPDYKFGFGREARTVVYEDDQGKRIFTFDFDVAEPKEKRTTRKLFLDPGPGLKEDYTMFRCESQNDRDRVVLMKQRVKQYLASLSYDVEIL